MRGLWSVARSTLTQCFRMKVAGVFILLMAALLIVMPFTFARYGDGTQAGRIRTFLAYGLGLTAFLLSVMTMLVATSITAGDIERKYVFTLAVKPLPRWQYILGRWVGMVALNAILLAISTLFIYVMAQRLRMTEPSAGVSHRLAADDLRAVETEVFAARGKVQADWDPDRVNFEALIAAVIAKDKETKVYERQLEDQTKELGSKDAAVAALDKQYRQREITRLESIGPGQETAWMFRDVEVVRTQTRAPGKVLGVDVRRRLVWVEAPQEIRSRVIYMGPVRVNHLEGFIWQLRKKDFEAGFPEAGPDDLAAFKPGQTVMLVAEPTVQVQYELSPVGGAEGATYRTGWIVENPKTGDKIVMRRDDPGRSPQTLTVSSRYVSDDGRLRVTFRNLTGRYDIVMQRKDVAALYPMGRFEMNLLKGALLLLFRLTFVSALGVCLGAFLSFPVACLAGLVLLLVSTMAGFVEDATKLPRDLDTWEHVAMLVGHYSRMIIRPVAPNFVGTSPTEALVAGTYIPWASVGVVAAFTVLGHTLLAVGAGLLLYQWRELARVQV
jgi:hypothetical protein